MTWNNSIGEYDYEIGEPMPLEIVRACGCRIRNPFGNSTTAAARAYEADFASTSCEACKRKARELRQKGKSPQNRL